MELKQERSAAAFRQTAKWLVISVSFHKCRVPFLEIENFTMRLYNIEPRLTAIDDVRVILYYGTLHDGLHSNLDWVWLLNPFGTLRSNSVNPG